MTNKTKIIATIGPASSSRATLEKLIEAGMDVARLNFSHGDHETHAEVIRHIREISRSRKKAVAILLDLQGPKIRTGRLADGKAVMLKRNATFTLTTRELPGTAQQVSTTYQGLVADVSTGDRILLDDGLIELQVVSKSADAVTCRVVTGGALNANKGINLPGVNVSAPSLTEKDEQDLKFGIEQGVDLLALSFVRQAEDIAYIKARIREQGAKIPVIAKIEKPAAVENLDPIIAAADGIMVARGDLGVEMNPEQVPTIQKHIIKASILANRPVITATQMLETMVTNPIPTRAEASDVANAIFDGTDAVMLSGETAVGRYPVKAVEMMAKIATQAERSPFMRYNLEHKKDPSDLVPHAVAQSAVKIVKEVDARGIVAFSMSGSICKLLSKHRPSKPIYAFTPSRAVYNRMALVWGLSPLFISRIKGTQRLIEASEEILLRKKMIRHDDLIVIVVGLGLKKGSTNIIKIHRVGHED